MLLRTPLRYLLTGALTSLAISADDLHHWQETLAEAEALAPA